MKDFAAAGGVRPKTAADVNVIAFDLIAVFGNLDLGAKEPDVADIVLGAGIRAAGEVNVHRRVEFLQPGFAPSRDIVGMAFGVGQREATAGIAGAGDEAGADRGCLVGEADCFDRCLGFCNAAFGNA
jgi:hypothetical protein